MFIAIADINLLQLQAINDFVTHSLITAEQLKQLFDDNQGNSPLPVQLEQFVLDHILKVNSNTFFKRETYRDEALVDLYTSFLNDLLRADYTPKQTICMITLLHGLLCQIERTDKTNPTKLNEAFIHSCSILMGEKSAKKPVVFNAHLYPKVIDYIVQIIFQHRRLYETLLEAKPEEIENIEETRTIDFHLFEEPLFPYPLTEALPASVHREVILKIPTINETGTDDQTTQDSSLITTVTAEEPSFDLVGMIDNISRQYPNVTREQIQQIFAEVSQEYLTRHNENVQEKLREKETSLLMKFNNLQLSNKTE
ncbi:unnamed protein product [Adineta ricciae]|uniref:Uncharacterized protein n=1 Tax=Adineta ricciae TaxID=249248 RepID=A0A814H0Q6_ADIRI|nr:unnamed protein product [Adineta ricciae]CAF1003988.1 unnamed protein product [Adineta ricciae]